MRTFRHLLVAVLVLVLAMSSSGFAAERHAVAPGELGKTVAQHVAGVNADRAAVRDALARPEVREAAARAGIDIDRVAGAVDRLDPGALAQAASAARDVNRTLVGGASTITVSTTTIILVLLIVILILVAD